MDFHLESGMSDLPSGNVEKVLKVSNFVYDEVVVIKTQVSHSQHCSQW